MSENFLYHIIILSKNYNIMKVMTRTIVGDYYIYDTHQNAYKYMKYLVDNMSGTKNDCEDISDKFMSYESKNLSSNSGIMHFYEGLCEKKLLLKYDSEKIDDFYKIV